VLGRSTPAAILVSILLAAACTDHSPSTPAPTTVVPSSTTTLPRGNLDGQLRIGVLLPQTGPGMPIGLSMTAAVQMAVKEINAAGGVNGQAVSLSIADEGSTQEAAAKALDDLLNEQKVDAIVGPASSKVALALIDRIVDARVATCSPTATATALSDYPDKGYFFRTMASDDLQAKALGEVIADAVGKPTAIVFPDDEYGRRISQTLTATLSRQDTKITSVTSYDATVNDPSATYYPQLATAVLKDDPSAVAVIGLPDAGGRVIAALQARSATPPAIFVSDGMRVPNLFDKVQPGKPESVAGIEGTSPAPDGIGAAWFTQDFAAANPAIPDYYGAYAYDCTNLIALAAQAAQTDDASRFIDQVVNTSRAGVDCRNFTECSKDLAEGRNIDLNGASGRIELLPNGDASYGAYDIFAFGPDGKDQSLGVKTETLP
jgi:ABC-type branched-subunit amino acid transport system substrate-binding protein